MEIQKLQREVRNLEHKLRDNEEENEKLTKTCNSMQDELSKLLERIKKLKARRGKIDIGLKSCRYCAKEFLEDENFAWSCRTHQGDYSELDDIWWCCGKKGK